MQIKKRVASVMTACVIRKFATVLKDACLDDTPSFPSDLERALSFKNTTRAEWADVSLSHLKFRSESESV